MGFVEPLMKAFSGNGTSHNKGGPKKGSYRLGINDSFEFHVSLSYVLRAYLEIPKTKTRPRDANHNPRSWVTEAGGSGGQDYPWFHSKFEAKLCSDLSYIW